MKTKKELIKLEPEILTPYRLTNFGKIFLGTMGFLSAGGLFFLFHKDFIFWLILLSLLGAWFYNTRFFPKYFFEFWKIFFAYCLLISLWVMALSPIILFSKCLIWFGMKDPVLLLGLTISILLPLIFILLFALLFAVIFSGLRRIYQAINFILIKYQLNSEESILWRYSIKTIAGSQYFENLALRIAELMKRGICLLFAHDD